MNRFLISVLILFPALASAQQSVQVNSNTIDYVSSVTSAIDSLVTSGSPLFLSTGNQILTSLGIIMLAMYGLKWAAASASRHHAEFDFPALIHFFALFLIAETLMRYYNVPLPWTSVSVHQIFPDTARQFAATIDLSILDTLVSKMAAIVAGTERPSMFNPVMIGVYYFILFDMTIIEGVLFALNIIAFVFIGIGSLLGPLFLPWLIVPRLSWLFWNWIQFMLQYSFYRVIASALTYVWANVLVNFLDHSVHGDYTLAHFLIMLVPLGMLNIGMGVTVFKVSGVVSDLFKGGSAAGGNLAGSVAGIVRGAFL